MKPVEFFQEMDIWGEEIALPLVMDEQMRVILGLPNFYCGPRAQLLRSYGVEIPEKAEDEQAFWIHFCLSSYLTWGDSWESELADRLKAFIAKARG